MGGSVASSGVGGGGGVGGIVEPPGPTKLTIVNGVADYAAIRLCFVPYPAGATGELPWPGVQGLEFARAGVIDPVGSEIPAATDVEVVAIAGSLNATGGATCADLMAAQPNGVLIASLGVVPESVFTEEKSLLFVPSGCMGGVGHSDDSEDLACGVSYSELTPNATLVAGFMSRIFATNKLNMQFAHASWAVDASTTVRMLPAGGVAQLLVPDWTVGAIGPFPPYDYFATSDLANIDAAVFELYEQTSSEPIFAAPLATAFGNSRLSSADVSDGSGLVFVGLGASPHAPTGGWWNDYTITVVASEP
jgi:hypothetical protein